MNVTMASIFMLVTATSLNSPNLINNYINEIDYKQFKTELQNKNCNVLSSNTIQYSLGYVKGDNLNVRKEPNTDSEILDVISFNKKIKYSNYNKDWLKIKYNKKIAYVYKKYVSKKKIEYTDYSVPNYSGFKSWMDYHKITMNGSEQKFLQENYPNEQAFNTRNIIGDIMETVYNEDGIIVYYCYGYEYIEIFGLTDVEFEDLIDEYGMLKNFNI